MAEIVRQLYTVSVRNTDCMLCIYGVYRLFGRPLLLKSKVWHWLWLVGHFDLTFLLLFSIPIQKRPNSVGLFVSQHQ